MENNPKVSIVVSIYNVEKYLERCVNSIVNQTLKDIEIILVDDGSTDNCPQICDKYAEKDSRIKVLHKNNEGLGLARNSGLKLSTGKYICFFDSDDYIEKDAIQKCYELAFENRLDLVIFGFADVDENGIVKNKVIPNLNKKFFEKDEIKSYFLNEMLTSTRKNKESTNLWMSAWNTMYSKQLIDNIEWKFVSERKIISEDVYSLLNLYSKVDRIGVISEALYYYCKNETSLTHTYRSDRFENIKCFYDECMKLCEELNYDEKVKLNLAYPYLANVISALKMIITTKNNTMKEKIKEFNKVIDDKHLQRVLKEVDLKKEPFKRKIFFFALKHKLHKICFFIVKQKS